MLIIEQSRRRLNAYDVKAKEPGLGRGFTVIADNLEEVKLAVEHYYRRGYGSGNGHGNLDFLGARCAETGQNASRNARDAEGIRHRRRVSSCPISPPFKQNFAMPRR